MHYFVRPINWLSPILWCSRTGKPVCPRKFSLAHAPEASMIQEDRRDATFSMFTEDKIALIREVLPGTLRSLFLLRIILCTAAGGLALIKILLSPPLAAVFLDIFSEVVSGLDAWMRAMNLIVSGLLGVALSLVIATFLIQARLQTQANKEAVELGS
jgi:hypothetical protein